MSRIVTVVLACSLLLAGCGASSADRSRATATETWTKVTPQPGPSPTLPRAADGDDILACTDGSCEILVTGEMGIRFDDPALGVAWLSVTGVGPDGVDLQVVTAAGATANLISQTPDQGGASVVNELTILVVTLAGDRAVLRLAHS